MGLVGAWRARGDWAGIDGDRKILLCGAARSGRHILASSGMLPILRGRSGRFHTLSLSGTNPPWGSGYGQVDYECP